MSPFAFLGLTLCITIGAAIANAVLRHRHRRALRLLAARYQMHYSPDDRFSLAVRLAGAFPIPGAADVKAMDVIYGTEDEFYRYLLTAEYTTGVVHSKKRRQRVCTLREPKSANGGEDVSTPILAPADLNLLEQYQRLYEREIAPESRRPQTKLHRPAAFDTIPFWNLCEVVLRY